MGKGTPLFSFLPYDLAEERGHLPSLSRSRTSSAPPGPFPGLQSSPQEHIPPLYPEYVLGLPDGPLTRDPLSSSLAEDRGWEGTRKGWRVEKGEQM